MKILGLNVTFGTDKAIKNEMAPQKARSTNDYIEGEQKFDFHQDLLTLTTAIEEAQTPDRWDRYDLNLIYRRVISDPEVAAQWETRVLKTLDKEFHLESVEENEVMEEAARDIFKAPWFLEWVRLVLASHLWNFTLIEFGPWNEELNCFEQYIDNKGYLHTAVEAVDRDYVRVEKGLLLKSRATDIEQGIPFYRGAIAKRLMFVGTPKLENSILYDLSAYLLMKENAHKNWSEWAEVFAMDMRVGKTEAEGEPRQKFIDAVKNMGSNSYAVIDPDDVIEYVGVARQDAYMVYERFLQYVDGRVAKRIFGQDVVTNNTGRVVGKVGEEVSNLFGDSDAKLVQWLINTKLIPYMIQQGAPLDGIKFKYDTTEKVKLYQRADIDKKISEMGYQINQDYLERTYGVELEEYIGVPFSGTQPKPGEEDTSE